MSDFGYKDKAGVRAYSFRRHRCVRTFNGLQFVAGYDFVVKVSAQEKPPTTE